MCGIDHLGSRRSPAAGQRVKQIFPDAPLGPTDEPIIDCCPRAIFGWAVAPSAAALQYVNNATDDAAIVNPFDPAHIRWQMRFNPLPLPITQPKQVLAHDPDPFQKRIRIALSEQMN